MKSNAREAALEAVGQARQAVADPTLAVVFGSIHLQQDLLYELVGTNLGAVERRVIQVKGRRDPVVAYECSGLGA